MATIAPQTVSGGALTYAAASAGGDTVTFGSSTRPVILVRNASGGSVTVTLTGVNPCSQGFNHSVAYACAVGDTEIDPPSNTIAANGNVALTYSATTSVTVAAVTS